MVKNWFRGICVPRLKDRGEEDGNDVDDSDRDPERLTGNAALELVEDSEGGEQGEEDTRGHGLSSSEEKGKKKKKDRRRRKLKKKEGKVNEDDVVDQKDKIIENLKEKLEEKQQMIDSLHETVQSLQEKVGDMEQRLTAHSRSSFASRSSFQGSRSSMHSWLQSVDTNEDNVSDDDEGGVNVSKESPRSNSRDAVPELNEDDADMSIDIANSDVCDDESLDPNEIIPENKSLSDAHSDDASLDGVGLFEPDHPIPRPKKQFLEAALTAKSLSDLNYVHSVQGRDDKASRWKSMTDLKYDDDGSLGDDEAFELDPPVPPTKNLFLDAALAAKSISNLNAFYSAQPSEDPKSQGSNDSNESLGVEIFALEEPIVRPKKQFLEAAFMAKSLSDLNYVHSTSGLDDKASRWKSMTDLKYDDDGSLGDHELFELDPPVPPAKNQFLDAALAAKSMSDLNVFYSAQPVEGPAMSQGSNDSNTSLGNVEIFALEEPIVRPKKQFLEAAFMAKSLSDLSYVHSAPGHQKASRRKSLTDLKYDDDKSLGDHELFELDPPVPPAKNQFLDAALAAKSMSDLNVFYSAQPSEDPAMSQDFSDDSNTSLGNMEIFALEEPILRTKKPLLDAAFMAKSLSDLSYVHSAPGYQKASRRKSLTDLKYDDDRSLGDEAFELDPPVPPTKNQFLDAALAAKSISDLNVFYSAQSSEGAAMSQDSNESNESLGVDMFALEEPILRTKKPLLDAAFMAKSLSDLNYVHSDRAHKKATRRKSMTDLKYDDDRSLGDNELFDFDPIIPRPKKQFLEAALMAKSLSDLKFMYFVSTSNGSVKDDESRDDTTNVVPEHLLRLSQPNLFHSSDIHSIDNDDLFESLPEDQPIDRPILKAALEAKAQQQEGIVVVSNRDAPSLSSNDQTEIVPEHLVIANQPVKAHAHDNYSIEVEDIFDHNSVEQKPRKPLLKAALEAQAQIEEEGFAKSMSYLGATENLVAEFSSLYQEFSKSVPDHLAIVHQPTNELPTLDELSIDNDRLFDSPEPKGKNPLLKAALRAKEEKERFHISRGELHILAEAELKRGDESN